MCKTVGKGSLDKKIMNINDDDDDEDKMIMNINDDDDGKEHSWSSHLKQQGRRRG